MMTHREYVDLPTPLQEAYKRAMDWPMKLRSHQVTLVVGSRTNAGFGEFVPVMATINGKERGVDAYLGTGRVTEDSGEARRELVDWQDGNGLLGYVVARDIWAAVKEAGY